MKDIPDKSVDISLTSPPYNLGKDRKNGGKIIKNLYPDNLNFEQYIRLIGLALNHLLRITKYHIFLNIQEYKKTRGLIKFLYSNYSNYIKEDFIWYKINRPPQVNETEPIRCYEHIFCLSHDDPRSKVFTYCNFSNKNRSEVYNLLEIPINNGKGDFQYAFPEKLPSYFINYFSMPGDIILDCFNGSGTTSIAALKLNRNYIGIEIAEQTYAQSVKRVNDYKSQMKLEYK